MAEIGAEKVVEMWLHGYSKNTRDAYRRDVHQYAESAGVGLLDTQLEDVQLYADELEEKGLAASTRARKLSAVKNVLAFAARQGRIDKNPAAPIRMPKAKDTLAEKILTEGEVTRLIHLEESERNRLILRTLYAAALRVSELVSLQWRDLQPSGDSGQINVFGKGDKTEAVLIDEGTWKALQAWRGGAGPGELLFPLTRQHVYRIVRRAAENAGIDKPVSPHWLRHSHVSHALDRGAPAHLVRDTARHADLSTTSRYAHARPDDSSSRYLAL